MLVLWNLAEEKDIASYLFPLNVVLANPFAVAELIGPPAELFGDRVVEWEKLC